MDQPFVSIIITVLNGGETLGQCLSSIHNQTFSDYELVIIDGGSSDCTLQIINSSAIRSKIVRVFPGIGLYAGLNAGVKLSVGQWLYFIGADDELHSTDTLHKVSEVIRKGRSDTKVFVGNVECVKQKNILRPEFGSPHWMRHQVHHQGMFYDRNIFKDMLYNENMRIASDYEFNLQLALIGVVHQSMNMTICNFGGNGISENQLKQGYAEMQQVHKRLFKGFVRQWVVNYFWFRRYIGSLLRQHNLLMFRAEIKKVFG